MSNFKNGQYSVKTKTFITTPGQQSLSAVIGNTGRLLGIQCKSAVAGAANCTIYLTDGATIIFNIAAGAAGENRIIFGPAALGVSADTNITINAGSLPWPLPAFYTDTTAAPAATDYKITITATSATNFVTVFYMDES